MNITIKLIDALGLINGRVSIFKTPGMEKNDSTEVYSHYG